MRSWELEFYREFSFNNRGLLIEGLLKIPAKKEIPLVEALLECKVRCDSMDMETILPLKTSA